MIFSDEQKKIIEHTGGHELVIACPGSGKTTTILKKIEHLVTQGTDPKRILVVTFTKAAAKDMADKFKKNYSQISGICFSTIHAICFSILKNEYNLSGNNILKEWEILKYYKTYLKPFIAQPNTEDAVKDVISKISAVRNAGANPIALFPENIIIQGKEVLFAPMYRGYEHLKKTQNKIDFDDMLILCKELFKKQPEILKKYQSYYDYTIIDEYQDTNKIQAEIFYMLSEKTGNLCVVGDDDQSIYRFRAADSGIMLQFSKKFDDTVKFNLSTNYRCGKKIVEYADNLIRHNKERFNKKFETGTDFDGKVCLGYYNGGNAEIMNLVKWLQQKKKEGIPLKEMAILYRTNNEVINMMPAFKAADIPISMKERPGNIHQHFIFETIQAYYFLSQLVTENEDAPLPAEAKNYLGKVLNCPSRYVRADFFRTCNLSEKSIRECIKKYAAADSKVHYRKDQIKCDLEDLLYDLYQMKNLSAKSFLRTLKRRMGFEKWVEEQAKFRGMNQETAKEILKNIIAEGESFSTMKEWMEYTGEFEEYLENAVSNEDGVRLSTFHGAKGLEWTCVWIINANNGHVPHKHAIQEEGEKGLEEERRLFYVAMTRAKKDLQISYVETPSSFLRELFKKDEKIEISEVNKQCNIEKLKQSK